MSFFCVQLFFSHTSLIFNIQAAKMTIISNNEVLKPWIYWFLIESAPVERFFVFSYPAGKLDFQVQCLKMILISLKSSVKLLSTDRNFLD